MVRRETGRPLDYQNLSGEEATRFATMSAALEVLASSEGLWRLDDAAGRVSVSSEVASAPERTPATVGQLDTPGIRASLPRIKHLLLSLPPV